MTAGREDGLSWARQKGAATRPLPRRTVAP